MNLSQRKKVDQFSSFVKSLRGPLTLYGIDGFDLDKDPTEALRKVVVVAFEPRENANYDSDLRRAFVAKSIHLRAIDSYPEDSFIRYVIKESNESSIRTGGLGAVVFHMLQREAELEEFFPVSFDVESLAKEQFARGWKEMLMHCFNTGRMTWDK